MHKLLVAIDRSETALRALRHAISLAKAMGSGSIHLVTAHEAAEADGAVSIYATHDKLEELQREHSNAILADGEALLKEAGVPYSTEVLTGRVAQAIARRADELGCNMIVMGTRGMSAIGSLVMGSVSMKVVHFAHVPVVLVK
jgi:nucleotide-binding universal stress UspA family protein